MHKIHNTSKYVQICTYVRTHIHTHILYTTGKSQYMHCSSLHSILTIVLITWPPHLARFETITYLYTTHTVRTRHIWVITYRSTYVSTYLRTYKNANKYTCVCTVHTFLGGFSVTEDQEHLQYACTRVKYSTNIYTIQTILLRWPREWEGQMRDIRTCTVCTLECNTYLQNMSHTTYIRTLYDTYINSYIQ